MKRLTGWMAVAILAAAVMCGCSKDDDGNKNIAPPQLKMVGADIDAVHEIEDKMSVKVEVAAPAGIKTFSIKIESPALSDALLGVVGLASEMDLVNPATPDMAEALKTFGFPVGEDVAGKKTLSFDISTLIPLIKALPATASADHVFTLTVGDAKNQTTIKALKFHTTVLPVAYNKDANLWENTATLKVILNEEPVSPALEYKRSTDTDWQTATLTATDGGYTAKIEPTWKEEANHASGAKQYSLDGKTGVFAGKTYDYRLLNDGKTVEGSEGTFTTEAGPKIPGGDMNAWSTYAMPGFEEGTVVDVVYPNAVGNSFWSSGNNPAAMELCQEEKLSDANSAAKLHGFSIPGFIFAAGNMFTGEFEMSGLAGYARFGQKYAFAARPTALKVRYKATITKIEELGLKKDSGLTTDDFDEARILLAITNWTSRHSVYSGFGVTLDQVNAFDPETMAETAEGKVLAYGSKWIDASKNTWTELTIPVLFLDKTTKPKAENFSLVISTSASAFGDFLCGSGNNELQVDDFEWVY